METISSQSSPNAASDRGATGLVCLRCSAENGENRKFCGECGATLWFDCDKCGKPHSATERFCGTCGSDVAGRIAMRLETLQTQLVLARTLIESCRFEDAQAQLVSIARQQDLRLEGIIDRARALLAELPERRRSDEDAARRRFEDAQAFAASGRTGLARRELEAIPTPLRSREAQALLDRFVSDEQEIGDLKREVKELYRAKRTVELLPRLERLTQLVPAESKYATLLRTVTDAIFERGRKRYADFRFADALEDFRTLPVSFVQENEEVEKQIRRAEEMLFLEQRLTTSPWMTPAVEAMTAAFVARAPEAETAKTFAKRLSERKRSQPDDPRRTLVEWRKVSREETVYPTQEHAFSRRLVLADGLSEEAARLWKSEPGRFFSAIGAALQALDRGAVEASFAFEEKKSALAGLSLFREKPKAGWGLDCSPSSLKGALLAVREDSAIELRDLYLSESVVQNGDDDFGGTRFARGALKAFKQSRLVEKRSLEGVRIAACLPSDSLIGRWFEMPVADKKTFERMIAIEAKAQIPIPLDELCWTWQRLDAALEAPAGRSGAKMMLLAVRRTWLENWHSAFREAEIKPFVVLPDAIASASYVRFEWNLRQGSAASVKKGVAPAREEATGSPDLRPDEAVALADLGAFHTNLVIVGEGLVWFRSFGCGSHRLTQKLAGAYRLTISQAESFKRDPFAARRFAHLYSVAQPQIDDFRVEIERSLKLFRNAYPDRPIRQFYVAGGGSRFDGFAAAMALRSEKFFE